MQGVVYIYSGSFCFRANIYVRETDRQTETERESEREMSTVVRDANIHCHM
jgi:hypothetical protein